LTPTRVLQHGAFLGDAYLRREHSGFSMGAWFARASGPTVKPHGHLEPHFMFALSGEYHTAAEGRGSADLPILIYNPPQTYHTDRFLSPRSSFFSISIDMAQSGCVETLRARRVPTVLNAPSAKAVAMRLLATCTRWQDDSDIEAEALSLELVGEIAAEQTDRTAPRWITQACDSMRVGVSSKIRIADLVRAADVHPVHFARTFRTAMRCTPGEYLRTLRLQRAVRLLTTSKLPLAAVANDCGFADQAHLTRRFRAAFGVPPAVFRQNAA
jgi:AraC family transcriptional regulator